MNIYRDTANHFVIIPAFSAVINQSRSVLKHSSYSEGKKSNSPLWWLSLCFSGWGRNPPCCVNPQPCSGVSHCRRRLFNNQTSLHAAGISISPFVEDNVHAGILQYIFYIKSCPFPCSSRQHSVPEICSFFSSGRRLKKRTIGSPEWNTKGKGRQQLEVGGGN